MLNTGIPSHAQLRAAIIAAEEEDGGVGNVLPENYQVRAVSGSPTARVKMDRR